MAARTVSTPAAEPARTPSLQPIGVIAVVTTQSMPQQTDVECRLACLGAAGDEDVETRGHRGLEEAGGLAGQRAQRHQLGEAVRLQHEPADVDRHVPAGDVGLTTQSRGPSGIIASAKGPRKGELLGHRSAAWLAALATTPMHGVSSLPRSPPRPAAEGGR